MKRLVFDCDGTIVDSQAGIVLQRFDHRDAKQGPLEPTAAFRVVVDEPRQRLITADQSGAIRGRDRDQAADVIVAIYPFITKVKMPAVLDNWGAYPRC